MIPPTLAPYACNDDSSPSPSKAHAMGKALAYAIGHIQSLPFWRQEHADLAVMREVLHQIAGPACRELLADCVMRHTGREPDLEGQPVVPANPDPEPDEVLAWFGSLPLPDWAQKMGFTDYQNLEAHLRRNHQAALCNQLQEQPAT